MNRILLYADDPGAANYLAPLLKAFLDAGYPTEFIVDPALERYVTDRDMAGTVRPPGASAETLLSGFDLLVAGTSENRTCFGNQLIDAARALRVPSVGVIDMEVNAAHRFQGNSDDSLCHAPDLVVVPDEACRSAFMAIGLPASRIAVCGHPHYDVVRACRDVFTAADQAAMRLSAFPDAPAGRPIWLFLAEGIDRLNPDVSYRSADYTLAGRGDSDFRACIVLEEILDAAAGLDPRPWIVLRLHPKSVLSDFDPVRAELGAVSAGGDPLPLVWAADLVLGMTTMLLQETYLLGRPHLSVLPRPAERAWLGTLASGLTPWVCTSEALAAALAAGPVSPVGDSLPIGGVGCLVATAQRLLDRTKP